MTTTTINGPADIHAALMAGMTAVGDGWTVAPHGATWLGEPSAEGTYAMRVAQAPDIDGAHAVLLYVAFIEPGDDPAGALDDCIDHVHIPLAALVKLGDLMLVSMHMRTRPAAVKAAP